MEISFHESEPIGVHERRLHEVDGSLVGEGGEAAVSSLFQLVEEVCIVDLIVFYEMLSGLRVEAHVECAGKCLLEGEVITQFHVE